MKNSTAWILPAALAIGIGAWASSGCGGSSDAGGAAAPITEDADASEARRETSQDGAPSPGNDGDAGVLGCGSPEVLICDGFDDPSIDTSRWEQETQSGAVAVDAARAFRGSGALHVTITAGGGRAMLRASERVHVTGEHVWGRAHMFVPASTFSSLTSHSNVVAFGGKNARGATAVNAVATGAGAFFGLYYQDEPMIDESSFILHPDVPITSVPLDRWFCLEWELDGVTPAFRLYLDGALIPSSVIEGRDPPADADFLLGAEFDLEEAWLDEVVVARRRAGCLR